MTCTNLAQGLESQIGELMAAGHLDGAQIRIVLGHRDERLIGQLRTLGYAQLAQLQAALGDLLDRLVGDGLAYRCKDKRSL